MIFTSPSRPRSEFFMFLEHLSSFRMTFLVNTKVDVVGIGGFTGLVDRRFSSVNQMIVDEVDVTS